MVLSVDRASRRWVFCVCRPLCFFLSARRFWCFAFSTPDAVFLRRMELFAGGRRRYSFCRLEGGSTVGLFPSLFGVGFPSCFFALL